MAAQSKEVSLQGKHPGGNDDKDSKGKKRQKFWRENTKYDSTLKDTKKTILQKHRKTNLGQLL